MYCLITDGFVAFVLKAITISELNPRTIICILNQQGFTMVFSFN